MAKGVGEEVVEHALDLFRRAANSRQRRLELRPDPDVLGAGVRLDAAQAGLDDRVEVGVVQLQPKNAGVDAGELEEVVDEHRERPDLMVQRRQIFGGVGEAVLGRLEHRLH